MATMRAGACVAGAPLDASTPTRLKTLKTMGRVVQTTRIVVSEDGKTMTVLQQRDGTNVLVFEKQ